MRKYLPASKLLRAGKRALAVVLLGLLLGTLAAPATGSAAAASKAAHISHIQRDGVGDSPLVP